MKSASVSLKGTYLRVIAAILLLVGTPSFAATQDGAAVLKAMTAADAKIAAEGVTMEGTTITLPAGRARTCDPAAKLRWKFTVLSGSRIAYDREVIEVLSWKDWLPAGQSIPQPDPATFMHVRLLSFLSPEATGHYDFIGPPRFEPGVWPARQKKVDAHVSMGSLTLHPPNPLTYLDYLDLPLLLVGRGYAKHITSISLVEPVTGGLLSVKAEGKEFYSRATKWELVVEPAAAYLVRSATYYVDDSERTIRKPRYVITTSGLRWFGALALPEKFEQRDPLLGKEQPFFKSGTVTTGSLQGDQQFFTETVEMFQVPFPISTDVEDLRRNPPLRSNYPAGELLDSNALRRRAG